MENRTATLIDLSHVVEHGMTTYKGLPGPHICDYWTREESAANYDDGSTFQIGRIDMVANTGTYVDSPFHRFAEGKDLSELPLGSLADLDGLVVRQPYEQGLAVDAVLRRSGGKWRVVDHAIGATDVWYCDVGPRSLKAGWGC